MLLGERAMAEAVEGISVQYWHDPQIKSTQLMASYRNEEMRIEIKKHGSRCPL
jgi:hypothetical protein